MTAALEGGEWSAARPGRTLLPGKTRYPLYRRLGGPQGRSGRTENLVLTGIQSRTVQPVVSRYTDWATRPTDAPVYQIYFILEWQYMFRTVFPSIIKNSRLYIQQPNRHCCLLAGGYPLASRQQYLFDKCQLLYVQSWTPDDGRKDRPKRVECNSK